MWVPCGSSTPADHPNAYPPLDSQPTYPKNAYSPLFTAFLIACQFGSTSVWGDFRKAVGLHNRLSQRAWTQPWSSSIVHNPPLCKCGFGPLFLSQWWGILKSYESFFFKMWYNQSSLRVWEPPNASIQLPRPYSSNRASFSVDLCFCVFQKPVGFHNYWDLHLQNQRLSSSIFRNPIGAMAVSFGNCWAGGKVFWNFHFSFLLFF